MKFYFIFIFSVMAFGSFGQDYSMPVKDYEQTGFPNPAVKWTDNDLEKALDVLSTLKQKHPKALPKAGSAKSAACFNKLLAECSLSGMNDPKLSDRQKADLMRMKVGFSQRLLLLYLSPQSLIPSYSAEVARLYNLTLENTHIEFVSFDAYIAKHPKLTDKQRFQVAELKHGYHEIIVGVIADMSRSDVFKTPDQEVMSAAVRNSLKRDGGQLTLSAKTSIRFSLMKIASNNISAIEKRNLNDASAAINTIH